MIFQSWELLLLSLGFARRQANGVINALAKAAPFISYLCDQ